MHGKNIKITRDISSDRLRNFIPKNPTTYLVFSVFLIQGYDKPAINRKAEEGRAEVFRILVEKSLGNRRYSRSIS
jgi:hypothetical protein